MLSPSEPSAKGIDHVEYLIAAHAGSAPRPLAKVASGGELARISLAIRVKNWLRVSCHSKWRLLITALVQKAYRMYFFHP
jgi:hypothetical protein